MSKRFEIDMGLNASDVAKGAKDAESALTNLEQAVGDVGDESRNAGGDISDFTRKVVTAAREAGKSDDDIRDALRKYGVNAKEAERAIEGIGDEFKETGRDGERALDDLEDSLRDVQRQSEKVGDSVDDIDVRGRKAFGGMGEAAQEVTQEVGQNLGEAVSSVRGNISDLGQVGQDTLGGLAATIAGTGPAGIAGAAALAAGAVGLGLITAELESQNERVQQLKQYFADAWQAAVEGGRDYIDVATVIGEMNDIQFNPERAGEYKKIQEDAKALELDRVTLLQAAAGDQDALNTVTARANELVEEQNALVTDSADLRTRGRGPKDAAAAQELADLQALNDRWKQYGDINAENQQKARDAADATSRTLLKAVEDAESATTAVDDFGNTLVTLPDGQEIVIDAKTGKATSDVTKFKTDTDGVISSLNGRDIVLQAKASVAAAQREIDGLISRNNGRTMTFKGRVVTPGGSWDG